MAKTSQQAADENQALDTPVQAGSPAGPLDAGMSVAESQRIEKEAQVNAAKEAEKDGRPAVPLTGVEVAAVIQSHVPPAPKAKTKYRVALRVDAPEGSEMTPDNSQVVTSPDGTVEDAIRVYNEVYSGKHKGKPFAFRQLRLEAIAALFACFLALFGSAKPADAAIILQQQEKITAVMGGAATTNNPVVLVDYQYGSNRKTDSVNLNGNTAVNVVYQGANAQVTNTVVNEIMVTNTDTVSQTITLKRIDASANSYTLCAITLQSNDVLQYGGPYGLRVVDSNGNTRQVSTAPYLASNVVGQLGSGIATFRSTGTLYEYADGTGLQAAATGADKVIAVYSLPASSFDGVQFRGLIVSAAGNFAANGNTKQVKIIFNPSTAVVGSTVGSGGTVIGDTGASTGNNVGWILEGMVYKYGVANSNTQICQEIGTVVGTTHGGCGKATAATATENATILIAVTSNCTTTATDATAFLINVSGLN